MEVFSGNTTVPLEAGIEQPVKKPRLPTKPLSGRSESGTKTPKVKKGS
jgi:hypothetical protein